MDCKHSEIKENMIYCKALKKYISIYNCRNCALKLPPKADIPNEFKDVFGDIFK